MTRLCLIALLTVFPALTRADDYYVASIPIPGQMIFNGLTVATPWVGAGAIQDAYDYVVDQDPPAVGVHVIHVGAGTYDGFSMDVSPAGVLEVGGVPVREQDMEIVADNWTGMPGETRLKVDTAPFALTVANGCSPATVIRGFTIDDYNDGPTPSNTAVINIFGTHGSQGTNQFFPVAGSSPTIEDCTIKNNIRTAASTIEVYGGVAMAIATKCDPVIRDCTFEGNRNDYNRGVVWIYATTISPTQIPLVDPTVMPDPTFDGCDFIGNSATKATPVFTVDDGWGGAVYMNRAKGTFTNCTFTGNSAAVAGGAIYFDECDGTSLSDCFFSANQVPVFGQHGGAIGVDRHANPGFDSVTFTDCTFVDNEAPAGGAVWVGEITDPVAVASPVFQACSFEDNSATTAGGKGGAVYFDRVSGTLTDCTFSGNSSPRGAGLYQQEVGGRVSNCTFSGNVADRGAGVYLELSGADFSSCSFGGNTADRGAGLYCDLVLDEVTLDSCIFLDNVANEAGAGSYFEACSSVEIVDGSYGRNVVDGSGDHGGGLNADADTGIVTIRASTFTENMAPKGGGVWSEAAELTVSHCVFSSNEADSDGSALAVEQSVVADAVIANSLFYDNDAVDLFLPFEDPGRCTLWFRTTALFAEMNVELVNNTIAENADRGVSLWEWEGSELTFEVGNSILWENGVQAVSSILAAFGTPHISVDFSDVAAPVAGAGSGVISIDPEFLDPVSGNFRLDSSGSPCLNSGADAIWMGLLLANPEIPNVDLDEETRLVSTIDIGAYEE